MKTFYTLVVAGFLATVSLFLTFSDWKLMVIGVILWIICGDTKAYLDRITDGERRTLSYDAFLQYWWDERPILSSLSATLFMMSRALVLIGAVQIFFFT